MSACLDMKVSYQVIDIRKNEWLNEIKESGCNGILVWPSITSVVLKEMQDERLRIINDIIKIPVYPAPDEIWLLDNKRRVRDWLLVNSFEIPQTNCFFNLNEAMNFAENAAYPLVFKTVRGSVSRGVEIISSQGQAVKLIEKCFSKGVVPERSDKRNLQWDFVIFQEYLPDVEEKRMIRIGESYICIDKVKKGDYHSGSGYMKWGEPGEEFLNRTKAITDKGNFRSMNVDFFITKDNRILVNELHTLFHGPVIPDSNLKGRYILENDNWIFQPGNYYRNYCCNLRVENFLSLFNQPSRTERWLSLPAF